MPDDIEDARIRLAILQMQSQVRSTVEKDLFKYYRNLGSIIISVLAIFGVTVGWSSIKTLIEQKIESQITQQTKPAITDANTAADKARENGLNASIVLQNLRETLGRSTGQVEEMEERQHKNKADIERATDRIEVLARNAELQKQSAQPLTTITSQVAELATQLKSLSDLTIALSQQVETLANENAAERQNAAKINENLTLVSRNQEANLVALQQEQRDPRNNRIVYVQFAGGQRSKIETITDALAKLGWKIPGEERTPAAAGKHEVRYFYEEDEEAAVKLAMETNAVKSNVGIVSNVTPLKVPPGKQSRLGIIELWLEVPVTP